MTDQCTRQLRINLLKCFNHVNNFSCNFYLSVPAFFYLFLTPYTATPTFIILDICNNYILIIVPYLNICNILTYFLHFNTLPPLSYRLYHEELVIMCVHSFLFHVQPIISDSNILTCHKAKIFSNVSFVLPMPLDPLRSVPVDMTYSSLFLLNT